jgi:hypothetical protein
VCADIYLGSVDRDFSEVITAGFEGPRLQGIERNTGKQRANRDQGGYIIMETQRLSLEHPNPLVIESLPWNFTEPAPPDAIVFIIP